MLPTSPRLCLPLLLAATLCAGRVGDAGAERPGDGSAEHPVERRLGTMGTWCDLAVEGTRRDAALAASERAVRALEAAEARLSTWRQDTELWRLNQAPVGTPFPLSPALRAELEVARRWWGETGGAFEPAIGPLVMTWGLRTGGRRPTASELEQARAASTLTALRLGPGAVATRLRDSLRLEEGAWGKGAGLADAIAAIATSSGSAADGKASAGGDGEVTAAEIDLGGQVAVWRRAGSSRSWSVEVADPRRRARPVLALRVERGSVSTSGNSERAVQVGGERIGHILDPRTGRPAADFGSLTVWADDALDADCLSTGLFVLGPEAAMRWAAAHPGIEVLALREAAAAAGAAGAADADSTMEALATPGLRGRLTPLVAGIRVRYASAM